ncbi:hypothetical protein AOQ87_02485 [Candidatus Riesia pediculischaeffi]|uniref:YicC family protein n=2 Tax=Candidatus Riesia pediculischaeffi TaxID=428411 RepID=A0A1V0HKX9_9ENTR|nr:hypothetical protein AOQ87_02485 [Candidatus Riesia pediculischaeffi]
MILLRARYTQLYHEIKCYELKFGRSNLIVAFYSKLEDQMLGMTAYAKRCVDSNFGDFCLEIFSFNHRYLDILIHLPTEIQHLEFFIEDFIRKRINRGRLRFTLRFERNQYFDQNYRMFIDKRLVIKLSKFLTWIEENIKIDRSCSMDLLNWPGVIRNQSGKHDNIKEFKDLLSCNLSLLIEDLILYKVKEGENVKNLIHGKLEKIEKIIYRIRSFIPEFERINQDKLKEKLENLHLDKSFDVDFLKKDILTFVRHADILEEIDRIALHVHLSKDLIQKNFPIGKKLDFIFQEINRESNTISSKSNHVKIINLAIEIKVLVDQVREHIQNIE